MVEFIKVLLLGLILSSSSANGYRILAIFPYNGRSHFSVLEQVVKSLAEKGHQVDVITGISLKEPFPNYTEIIKVPNLSATSRTGYTWQEIYNTHELVENFHATVRNLCGLLGHPKLSNLIRNPPTDPRYDLVLTQFLAGYQCFTAIGHLWNVPVVGVITTALYPYNSQFIGNPLSLAFAPKNLRVYKENMDFWQRLYNFVETHKLIRRWSKAADKQDALIKKYLGTSVPHYTVLEKTVSLIFANSHFSFHGIEPHVPALVEIGGIHITNDNQTIDPNLKKLLDESPEGFLYFSFGSLAIIETFPKEFFDKLYSSFRKIAPIRIIMKLQNQQALPKNMPDNVYTFSWLPQRQILQHPKIKAFVSHGGGLGTQETLYYGVPTICIPFFADQYVNCDISSNKKIGIKLNLKTATQSDFDDAFEEILKNPIYKESVKKLSVAFRDRPRSPKQDVVYWVEYVIRHGKNSLRCPAVDMAWWQVELFDIYAFIASGIFLTFCIVFLVVRRLVKLTLSKFKELGKNHSRLSEKQD